MSLPWVVGRELSEAQRLLSEAGVPLASVTVTAPPKGSAPPGPPRVVRQRGDQSGVSLVVAASVPLPK